MKKLKTLIFSMIKVGCMGFGGGNALIPVIEEEAVKDKKLVKTEFYRIKQEAKSRTGQSECSQSCRRPA